MSTLWKIIDSKTSTHATATVQGTEWRLQRSHEVEPNDDGVTFTIGRFPCWAEMRIPAAVLEQAMRMLTSKPTARPLLIDGGEQDDARGIPDLAEESA